MSRRRGFQELGGFIRRRLASTLAAPEPRSSTGYVASCREGLISPLGDLPSILGTDPSARPEPFSPGHAVVRASFEDIQVLDTACRLFIASPTRFPGRWKMLPRHTRLMKAVGAVSVTRTKSKEEPLLLLVTSRFLETGCLLYSFHTNSWITCYKPQRLMPDSASSAAWFRGSAYMFCKVASQEDVDEMNADDDVYSGSENEYEDAGCDAEEASVFSIMRFDVAERRWHLLELSDGDVELLSNGLSTPLVLGGRLLVFSSAWGYWAAFHGISFFIGDPYVREQQARESWDGRSNPFRVFELEEDRSRLGWCEASESKRENMKKLVDVTEEFGQLVDTAWEQKAARFFTGDASYGDEVLFWVSWESTVERYHVARDELLDESPHKFYWAKKAELETSFLAGESKSLCTVYRDPGGEASVFSLFQGLPEINNSTSLEELSELLPFYRRSPSRSPENSRRRDEFLASLRQCLV